jgi:ketosteroid isomerase-like protein
VTAWDLTAVSAVARSWEAACRSLDIDRILSHLSDDAVIWYNYENIEHDRDAYRMILETSVKSFWNQRYRDMRVLLHPHGFVEQATLEGDTEKGVIVTPFLVVATVAGDRITRLEEYFDSTIMRSARER